jgi:dipeptide transport system ATP-binding protein
MLSSLEIQNLNVKIPTRRGLLEIVRDLSFSVQAGQTLGIVGESGCGKSMTSLAIMGLLPPTAQLTAGKFNFLDQSLKDLSESSRNRLRGKDMAMIFQDPMTSLNPCFTVEMQLTESLKLHQHLNTKNARQRAIELLDQVGIPSPKERLNSYPHQLSGGMSQRVMIAMAIACNPKLLIADEPTTALDVTIQAQILELLRSLVKKNNMALILITHDMAVVSQMADQILVMYAGEQVEYGSAQAVIENPRHPYTRGLLQCLPGNSSQEMLEIPHRSKLKTISGRVPDLLDKPKGCLFEPRCPYAEDQCRSDKIKLKDQIRCVKNI